nr:DNA primase [Nanchangia anserum]
MIDRDDIDAVRERCRIDEIVGEHVTLKRAGINSLKGLCPFHDERTPSFHIDPVKGRWHCFGCNEGGDTIEFAMRFFSLSFVEAVEMLAERYGIELHRSEDGGKGRERMSTRRAIAAANDAAQKFFAEALNSPEAGTARVFLAERGFGADVAAAYGLGYAPNSWDRLLTHLRKQGFIEAELEASGLFSRGQRGLYDRFRDRLIFPITSVTGQVVGFGARKLGDDEGPKYLNTPETELYQKSQVLYGLDRARKAISRSRQVVVVEGYTDVMAAHLAGIPTAVATCGTAFGEGHVKTVRRLLSDSADRAAGVVLSSGRARGGEIIFTFDGDEAGQKAALRAFREDQSFAAQTFVAVDPQGMDPCEVRLNRGNDDLKRLISSREPLFAFVIRTTLASCDLDTAEGRIAGLRACAPIVAGIRDDALSREYARQLAGWLGMPENEVRYAVRAARRGGGHPGAATPPPPQARPTAPDDPMTQLERRCLAVVLQCPGEIEGHGFDQLPADAFLSPLYRTVHDTIRAIGGIARFAEVRQEAEQRLGVGRASREAAVRRWFGEICEAGQGLVDDTLSALAVEPLPLDQPDKLGDYARGIVQAFQRKALVHEMGELRSRLSRLREDDPERRAIAERLVELERRRRAYMAQS